MSRANALARRAEVFAALGDATRLELVDKLRDGQQRSISDLAHGSRLTRQAVTKHLRVLENVGVVRNIRAGRESRFAFVPRPVDEMRDYLEQVSREWDRSLARLKAFVED
jgi:DNA-binding transcriptional ArsR family regulator